MMICLRWSYEEYWEVAGVKIDALSKSLLNDYCRAITNMRLSFLKKHIGLKSADELFHIMICKGSAQTAASKLAKKYQVK